jgi:uncharacterized membrane protein
LTDKSSLLLPEEAAISAAIEANLEKVARFAQREEEKASLPQRLIERISLVFGHPLYLIGFVTCAALYIAVDVAVRRLQGAYFDAPPFEILQGIISFNGVLITMAVLIRQNRLARVEQQTAHLELQVNLLAEQKATKIIELLEELRRDLPDVRDRHDPHAQTLQATTNPDAVLEAIEKNRTGDEKVG